MLRLSPVLPDSLMNYAMSLMSLTFDVFAAATFAAMIPWVLLYVYLGSASKDIVATLSGGGGGGDSGDGDSGGFSWLDLSLTAISIALGLAGVVYLGKVIKAAIAKAEAMGRREGGAFRSSDGDDDPRGDGGAQGGGERIPLLAVSLTAGGGGSGEDSSTSSRAFSGLAIKAGGADHLPTSRGGAGDFEERGGQGRAPSPTDRLGAAAEEGLRWR